MTRADLTTCGRNILPAPKRSPTTFMPSISGPSMTASGGLPSASSWARHFLGVGDDEIGDALDQRVFEALLDRLLAPREIRAAVLGLAFLDRLGELDQRLAGIRVAVEHHVLDLLAQRRLEIVVDAEHAGIDDAHGHAGLDGVVEENGVDRLAHGVVAAEAETTRWRRRRKCGRAAGSA